MTDATTLILTAADDTTADLVANALAVRDGKTARIDVGDFPASLSITGSISADGVWRGELVATDGAALNLESVSAVYYRRPTRFRLPAHLRVTAVGDRLFPIAIRTADPDQLDWRSNYDMVTYQHVELPAGVAAGIYRYLAATGLAFGAFDFVMDQAGTLWWMECNPNGEWGWLTEAIDVPIADALAELLLGQSPP
jgi:hypothetical protein